MRLIGFLLKRYFGTARTYEKVSIKKIRSSADAAGPCDAPQKRNVTLEVLQ